MKAGSLIFLLLPLTSVCCAQTDSEKSIYLGSGLSIDFTYIYLGNNNHVQQNPKSRLYSYIDGGLDNDVSKPQVDFEEETEDMLNFIGQNIDQRIDFLNEQYDELQEKINTHLPEVIEEDGKILAETQRLNTDLDILVNDADAVMDIQAQDRHQKYLKDIHAAKAQATKALDRAKFKRTLNEEAKADLLQMRRNLLDKTNYHSSDPALAVGLIATNINATSNLILDLLGVDPLVSNNPVLTSINLIKSTLNDELISGDFNLDRMQIAFAKAYTLDAMTAGRPLLQVTNGLYSYGKLLAGMTQLPSDHEKLKIEIKQQLDLIGQHLDIYTERIKEATAVVELHRNLIRSIDDYLDLNGLTDDLRYEPLFTPPPTQSIRPNGFDFPAFNLPPPIDDDQLSITEKEMAYEERKRQSHYPSIIERFAQYTSRGEPDPVFSSPQALESNQRKARMCMEFAGKIQEDFKAIKTQYSNVSETLIHNWMSAAKQTRYEAMGYLPLSDKTFRFTPLDMSALRSEMVSVIEYIQKSEVIPFFACNIYTAKLSNHIYGVSEDVFRHEDGQWLTANQLAAKAIVSEKFSLIGSAVDQNVLDQSAYYATIGKPVIAIYFNPTLGGHGHVNMILPGLNTGTAFKSEAWKRWVPLATNYSLTMEGDCQGCFTEGKLSEAFSAAKAPNVMLYIINN